MKPVYIILLASLFAPVSLAAETKLPMLSLNPTYSISPEQNNPAPSNSELPELGDVSATAISPLEEQRIADQIMREVLASGDVVSDVEITDYVTNLGRRLAMSGPDKAQPF